MQRLHWLSLYTIVLLVAFNFAATAAEQETGSDKPAFAIVLYAEGSEVTIYRNSIRENINADNIAVAGLPLFSGDIIQTGANSSVEFQLYPSAAVARLGANTSIELTSVSDPSVLELTFGRLRMNIQDEDVLNSVKIETGPISLQTSGADFGVVYGLSPSAPAGVIISASIAVFDGQVSIGSEPFEQDSHYQQDPAVLQTAAGRLLEVGIPDTSELKAQIHRSAAIPLEARTVWERHQVMSTPVSEAVQVFSLLDYRQQLHDDPRSYPRKSLPSPASEPASTAHVRDQGSVPRTVTTREPEQRYFVPNTTFQTIGISLFAIGAATELLGVTSLLFGDSLLAAWVPVQTTRQNLSYGLMVSGGLAMGLGVGSFFIGFSY